ncbi:RES family NAD+ phosphorylase [Planctopirus hydrillae]|uniref:RES domain-containing protein n=1 Tax=Planctopirus hydrillae TaxID=1841610 RepID=A0A1C3ETK3_9PLAN|nr:RES family NAD+ phosphorylase [Planctopirus hydrillae]ODA36534.1 hypothetical protein A6X21_02300 [Planctopirus hydrillae]
MSAGLPSIGQLKSRFTRLRQYATTFKETVFRSSTPKYANERDLSSGVGSKRQGGRWNPIGIRAVYASLTPEIALSETLAHFRYYGIPLQDAMPRTFVAMEANLQIVLDFREGVIRQRLQISLDRMLAIDWRKELLTGRVPMTQVIGQAAAESGLEGLVVPSAVTEGHNLLVFPENLIPGSRLLVMNADRLPD